jgi:hypothetical protein
MRSRAAVLVFVWLSTACSGNSVVPDSGAADSGSPDAGTADAGAPDASYAASHTAMPQAFKGAGPVMTAPRVIAISFDGDPNQSDVDSFVDELVATTGYWAGATEQYGVGPLATAVHLHQPNDGGIPLTDTDVQLWLKTQIQGDAGFPQPDANTLYALFYPPGVNVHLGGETTCQQLQGYHDSFSYAPAGNVLYTVVPRCPAPPVAGVTVTDQMAAEASHEIIEAATDPLPLVNPAYLTVDDNSHAWELVAGGEIGDLCAAFPNSFYKPAGIDYLVQRVWSNEAAAASHDPCQPAGSEPYFNSAPVLPDTITLNVGGKALQTKGVKLAVGESKTIELDLYSDAPTSGPWNISTMDVVSAFFGQSKALSLTLDAGSGQNGDKVMLTIQLIRSVPGGAPFWIQNDLGGTSSVWIGAVNTN